MRICAITRNVAVGWALLLGLGMGLATPAQAEHMRRLGDWEVHYVVIPTLFLKAEIAADYGLTRGRDRGLLNISVLDRDGRPVRAQVEGTVTNLLGQQQALAFREVREGEAVYYLALVRHTDQEVLRFAVTLVPPDETRQRLEFQQMLYWENP